MDGPGVPERESPPLVSGPLVRREVVLLLLLSVVAVGLFLITRRMAEWERERAGREAAYWFAEGQALLDAGRSEDAADVLRRSVLTDRTNDAYTLALARALTAAGRDAEARTQLMRLRELAPDNAEVHYQLARLYARGHQPDQATRHYYLALYSPETEVAADQRRRVGIELATHLLEGGDTERAADVLAAVAREASREPLDRLRLASLFERAGRLPEALNEFAAAAAADETSVAAVSGAGRVALAMDDYARAEAFLRLSVELGDTDDRERLDLVQRIVRLDPLARGLSSRARAARLADALIWAERTLVACGGDNADEGAPPLAAVRAFRRDHTAVDLRDADVLSAGVAVVAEVASRMALTCDDDATVLRVWRRIGDREGRES